MVTSAAAQPCRLHRSHRVFRSFSKHFHWRSTQLLVGQQQHGSFNPRSRSTARCQMSALQSAAQASAGFKDFLRQQPRIILGSASSSRRAIMDELAKEHCFSYEVVTADIDEQALGCRKGDWEQLVLLLAKAKAEAIIANLMHAAPAGRPLEGYLLTCDQVVVYEGQIREKPTSAEQAREFIKSYSTAPASTVGSVVCTNLRTGRRAEGVDIATISFHPIPEDVTEALIAEGDVFYCAGGLMVEHPLVAPLIKEQQGSQDSIMGLSKQLVMHLLPQVACS